MSSSSETTLPPASSSTAVTVEEEGDDEENESYLGSSASSSGGGTQRCPYLDTIERRLLDFDMQKVCSVTISPHHVYGCLVCGKFFGGRGKGTPAMTHSLQSDHHVFINLEDGRIWCLPDAYEVRDASLDDIRRALQPAFTEAQIAEIDRASSLSRDVLGVPYLPGFLGLNNLGHSDGVNAIIQALAHVHPLRNFFLRGELYSHVSSRLVQTFGALMRRLWSPTGYKGTISPVEFMVELSIASKKKFGAGASVEAADLLTFVLNTLHTDLMAKNAGRVAAEAVAAALKRSTTAITSSASGAKRPRTIDSASSSSSSSSLSTGNSAASSTSSGGGGPNFVMHRPPPLRAILYMTSLLAKWNKFDGVTIIDSLRGQYRERKKYRLLKLPPYLAMTVRRFKKNAFFTEKNPTIVTFPVKNLDLKAFFDAGSLSGEAIIGRSWPTLPVPAAATLTSSSSSSSSGGSGDDRMGGGSELEVMPISELKRLAAKLRLRLPAQQILEKGELVAHVHKGIVQATCTRFNLVANIVHENPPALEKGSQASNPLELGSYKVNVHHDAGAGQWYEIEDIHVQETLPETIGISQTYILIYKRGAIELGSR